MFAKVSLFHFIIMKINILCSAVFILCFAMRILIFKHADVFLLTSDENNELNITFNITFLFFRFSWEEPSGIALASIVHAGK